MWRFQLQALSEKKNFLFRLSTVSCVLHALVLALIFIGTREYKLENVSLHAHSAQVRFVPTFDSQKIADSRNKSMNNVKTVGIKSSKNTGKKQVHSIKKVAAHKKISEKQTTGLHAKGARKKQGGTQKNGKVPQKVQEKSKTLVQQKNVKKTVTKEAIKKESSKKDNAKKSVATQAESIKKNDYTFNFLHDYTKSFSVAGMISQFGQSASEKKVETEPRKDSIIPQEVIKEQMPEKSAVQEKEIIPIESEQNIQNALAARPVSAHEENAAFNESELIEDVMYVSPREYNALMIHQDLRQSLQLAWAPPPGISRDVTAQVTITVDKKGSVQSVIFKKHSGSLVYDASIEHALSNCILPESVWSKTLTITFSS